MTHAYATRSMVARVLAAAMLLVALAPLQASAAQDSTTAQSTAAQPTTLQSTTPQSTTSQPAASQPADSRPATPAAPTSTIAAPAPSEVSLEQAYRREHAFLIAQKRELDARLAELRGRYERERARLDTEIGALESAAIAARAQAESLGEALARAEEQAAVNADNRELITSTFEQAGTTLAAHGDGSVQGAAFLALDDARKLRTLFATALRTLASLGQVQHGPGRFYLADGSEVEGTVVRWGNVARYGIAGADGDDSASADSSTAGDVAGALAPAGGDRFRLWNAPAADSARALANGRTPETLRVFLYENAHTAVAEPESKSVLGEVRKGGMIGWIIIALGVTALVLVVLRAVFLKRAGARIQPIIDGVTPHVRAGRIDEAIAACKRFKGSAARVVTAALRNLDRDREHLEDIVSESILHESTHLNRFGAMIGVIAAVAPLLGLLGTVTGMIQTFDVITEFGTADPKLLSGGIAVALVTTELGLAVAIPAILAGSLLNGWCERLKDDMEKAALKVINLSQDVRARVALRDAA